MKNRRWSLWLWLVPVVLQVGCHSDPSAMAGTGAKEAAQGFWEGILRQDWPAAYAMLHADSRKRLSQERFIEVAKQYRGNWSFEPEIVHIRACEEHGTEAIAHVVFTGPAGSKQKFYKEAVALRHDGTGWGVVLPQDFGRGRAH